MNLRSTKTNENFTSYIRLLAMFAILIFAMPGMSLADGEPAEGGPDDFGSEIRPGEVISAPLTTVGHKGNSTRTVLTELPEPLKRIGFSLEKVELRDGNHTYVLSIPAYGFNGYLSSRQFINGGDDTGPVNTIVHGEFSSLIYTVGEDGLPRAISIENNVGEAVSFGFDPEAKKLSHMEFQTMTDYAEPVEDPVGKQVSQGVHPYLPIPGLSDRIDSWTERNAQNRTEGAIGGEKRTQHWLLDAYNPDLNVLRLRPAADPTSGTLDVPLELPSGITAWAVTEDVLFLQGEEKDCELGLSNMFAGLNEGEVAAHNMVVNLAEYLNQKNPEEAKGLASYQTSNGNGFTSSGVGPFKLQRSFDLLTARYHACIIEKKRRAGDENPSSDGYFVYKSTTGNSSILINPETGRVIPLEAWLNGVNIGEIAADGNSVILAEFDARRKEQPEGYDGPPQYDEYRVPFKLNLNHGDRSYSAEKQQEIKINTESAE